MSKVCEGALFVEIDGDWTDQFCWIRSNKFQAFERQKAITVAKSGKREITLEVTVISYIHIV